jgi:hypothetical protein
VAVGLDWRSTGIVFDAIRAAGGGLIALDSSLATGSAMSGPAAVHGADAIQRQSNTS